MKTLVVERNVARFAASRLASAFGSGRGAAVGPLRLLDVDPPDRPGGDGWVRLVPTLSGICGSDLATLDGRSSRYFEDLVSFPFVPGHEVVGVLDADGTDRSGAPLAAGTRAVIEPVLGCAPRGINPRCPACAAGHTGACPHLTDGRLAPGLQTGYCASTGGGWSAAGLWAHASQLHAVPDALSDEDAVMVEPTACAVHAVRTAGIGDGDVVAVVGAGTIGLAVVAALAHALAPVTPGAVVVGARYPHQRQLAERLGATAAVTPEQLPRAVRRVTRSLAVAGSVTGGADVVLDCAGTAESLATSLALTRNGGRVALVGMPGRVQVDLAPLWHRELTLAGAYAYGVEAPADGSAGDGRRTFDVAIDLVASAGLGDLVSATYPLERYEEALAHAGAAGRRGAVKIAFAPRNRKGRAR